MKKTVIYNLVILNFLLIGLKAELTAQPSFALDSTFQPFFDMSPAIDGGYIGSIWENPTNGNLHLAGDFKLWLGNDPHYSIVSTRRDGSRNYDFNGFIIRGMSFFFPINDSVFISGSGGGGVISLWT